MRTVMFITPRMIVGGAERYILEKSEWLLRNGRRAIVVSGGGVWEKEIERLGGRHYRLGFVAADPYLCGRSRLVENLGRLQEIVRCEDVSIVEASHLAPAAWGYQLSRLCRVPFFLNVLSGQEFSEGRDLYARFLQALDRKRLYYNAEQSNRLIEARKNIILSRCVEIPIPLGEAPVWPPGAAPADRYVLTVCRMAPEKMYVKALIRDFGRLAADAVAREVNLVVVGDGPCLPEVEALAARVNRSIERLGSRVILKGTVVGAELDVLFAGCLFYVGMGTTVLMAARARKSVVLATSEKGYTRWSTGFFGGDGHASLGFRQEGVRLDPFRARMRRLLEDPRERERLEESSYRLYREAFETEGVMQRWVREYDRIIAEFEPAEDDLYPEDALFYFAKQLKHRLIHRSGQSA